MAKKIIPFVFSILFSSVLFAQLETSADFRRQVYDREYTIGLNGHSHGFAINGRYLKHLDGFNKAGLEVEFTKIRHPKEVTTPSAIPSSTKGYVYGRVNSFFSMRVGYARETILFDKTDKGSVSISWITNGGLSFGLLKPIYLQVFIQEDINDFSELEVVRYNPEDIYTSIYGEAPFFRGIKHLSLKPGFYIKSGFSFDYNLLDKKVTSLEVGVIYDFFVFPQIGSETDGKFFSEVPIMYDGTNQGINNIGFLQFYLQANFGYKKS